MGSSSRCFVNWLVKPFSMALHCLGLLPLHLRQRGSRPTDADQYIAGCIILAAAPCTAMVFVWSYLTDGDPAYTLVQVSVNDLIMLVLFAPWCSFLWRGLVTAVPFQVLLVFRVWSSSSYRSWWARAARWCLSIVTDEEWFEDSLLPTFSPVTMFALLATLVLIFAFQTDNITGQVLPCGPYRRANHAAGLLQFRR